MNITSSVDRLRMNAGYDAKRHRKKNIATLTCQFTDPAHYSSYSKTRYAVDLLNFENKEGRKLG